MLVRIGNAVYEAPGGEQVAVWTQGSYYLRRDDDKGFAEYEPAPPALAARCAAAPAYPATHPLRALALDLWFKGEPRPWVTPKEKEDEEVPA